jgi:hypothetical protein
MYVELNIEGRLRNRCCSGKSLSIIYSVCVFVALGIQHAMRMRHIVICDLPGSTMFFSHYPLNGTIFREKVIEHKMCVLIFSTNMSEIFFILRRIQRDIIINVYRSSRKVPVILVRF